VTAAAPTDRIAPVVAALGATAAALAFAIGGMSVGIGATVGAVVGLGNWLVLRRVTLKIISSTDEKKAPYALLLVGKLAALLGLVWVLLAVLHVHPAGFVVGTGGLVLGTLYGSLTAGNDSKEVG
jgi:hypothetical protein